MTATTDHFRILIDAMKALRAAYEIERDNFHDSVTLWDRSSIPDEDDRREMERMDNILENSQRIIVACENVIKDAP